MKSFSQSKVWLFGLSLLLLGLAGGQYEKVREEKRVMAVCGDGCIKYLCPYGDTNDNSNCDEEDFGVSWNFSTDQNCANTSCGVTECCQVDYTQGNVYCGFKEKKWSCTPLATKIACVNNTCQKVPESGEYSTQGCVAVGGECGIFPPPPPSPSPSPSPLSSPSPSPAVSPSPSPSSSPSPAPDHAGFIIRKFKDSDKDGSWDSNETSTGIKWQFQYRINADPWQDYYTDSQSGWGGVVSISLGTKVEVKEIAVNGWVNTTSVNQIKILDEAKTYYFDFGNYTTPGVVEVSPPPQVPAAGQTSHWWLWVASAVVGLGLQAVALWL